MMQSRTYTLLDKFIQAFDQSLKVLSHQTPAASRANPALNVAENNLLLSQKKHSIALLRIDHTGEICAQALYQGQALIAQSPEIKAKLIKASEEENDHLHWCYERISELNGRPSYLNPLWYAGSFFIGAAAALIGDQWSLGFLVETEKQVIDHLTNHLKELPKEDQKTRKILEVMREDEAKHATVALQIGAKALPYPVKIVMGFMSKVMTTSAYWV